ncbi:hypothetical protein [Bradyrhizobium liaoningense]|uniref:hypothetical protein n=1 Tax=Bradyrhizobium liaoningense TaxID=43992 RepID=UPI001BABB7F4|nr:hypothetical protein [Bradyrhizobium liaoningense]MBR0941039.1 hypothetical protein [Bradyrhizobium liaoningense]
MPKLVELRKEQKTYTSEKMAYATSVGQEGHKTGKHCEPAPDGWHFVEGTAKDEPKNGTDGGEAGGVCKDGICGKDKDGKNIEAFEISPLIACINNWAYTGDKDVRRTREDGFIIVIERLVPVETPTATSVTAEKAKYTSPVDNKKRPKN